MHNLLPMSWIIDVWSLCLNPLWDRERPWISVIPVTVVILVLLVCGQMQPTWEVHIYL